MDKKKKLWKKYKNENQVMDYEHFLKALDEWAEEVKKVRTKTAASYWLR